MEKLQIYIYTKSGTVASQKEELKVKFKKMFSQIASENHKTVLYYKQNLPIYHYEGDTIVTLGFFECVTLDEFLNMIDKMEPFYKEDNQVERLSMSFNVPGGCQLVLLKDPASYPVIDRTPLKHRPGCPKGIREAEKEAKLPASFKEAKDRYDRLYREYVIKDPFTSVEALRDRQSKEPALRTEYIEAARIFQEEKDTLDRIRMESLFPINPTEEVTYPPQLAPCSGILRRGRRIHSGPFDEESEEYVYDPTCPVCSIYLPPMQAGAVPLVLGGGGGAALEEE